MTLENDTLAAVESARMRIIAQTERARTAAKDAAVMADEVRAAASTARSPGGEVSVTAQAGGAVTRVDITERGREWDARTLSSVITDTIRKAQREAAEAAVRRLSSSVGADSPLVSSVRAQIDAQFGADSVIENR
ncbi:YbaB/EbfC family nucleoid-associated protein [Microbacterium sp. cx-59]|uniref:YbaB/EbfC family nucleoid-associated protein n=1 Tax=Microbacterium sp. cx-59 TaxID=2891207 RepID=UPI001E53EAAB|nr:YbaB/EbfC family nucleoid-associated protein [Microbacterium sp. cx-59]MCC4907203.1 YbaB/EbfC family nucleoid-associated protein [Microbacterium sp. cx-59]